MLNSPEAATLAASIASMFSGTVRVGQTPVASATGIAGADGLANVSYSYQWLADDTENRWCDDLHLHGSVIGQRQSHQGTSHLHG